ncbi:MAG: hypothetical protein NT164_06380 [Verrucomicrobiae bacterium]|nr:hypothetical protein [Verrucomicrobiae bacterium]
MTIAPARNPTAEENQQIRNLIKEAFVVRYGRENAERSLPAIDAPENLTRPVRMTDLSGAFEQASEWMEQNAALVQNDESFSTGPFNREVQHVKKNRKAT